MAFLIYVQLNCTCIFLAVTQLVLMIVEWHIYVVRFLILSSKGMYKPKKFEKIDVKIT